MPELPDVEVFGRYLDSTALYLVIEEVEIEDERILKEIQPQEFIDQLKGKEFTSVRRHGKYLFVDLNSPHTVMFHFGMSGKFSYQPNDEEPPEYEKLALVFSNRYRLGFLNKRMLGQIKLIDDVDAFVEHQELGPDTLSEEMDWSYFQEQMKGRRGMVKSALMNQKILAGIGNEFSDEILFQLQWHPKKKVKSLSNEELEQLFNMLKKTLKQGVESNMDYDLMPSNLMIPSRNNGRNCPNCGTDLERVKVSGRNSTYCPSCQSES